MLPSPEQERKAIVAFTAFAVLSLLGAGALLFAIATVLVRASQWVWSF
jgi:hypothetical protein